ncbi:unnamed protein product [Camellia sinensis]
MRRMVVMRLKCLWRLRLRMRTIRSSMMPRMIAKTDTSLAIEAIFMKRWEFDSIEQAAKCISSWFSGTHHEQLLLKGYLESAIGHYVPQLAEQILHNNKNAPKDDYINLKGFINNYSAPHVPQNVNACPTLFVANLGPTCSEQELIQVFSSCHGFIKLKMQSTYGTSVAFVDFQILCCCH